MNIKCSVEDINNNIKLLKDDIAFSIKKCPDNSSLQRIGTNCFTIKSSDLKDSWSPSHYDTLKQIELIEKEIVKKNYNHIVPFLKDIVEIGVVRINNIQYHFNQQIREHIKKML